MNEQISQLRKTIIALLDDEEGITSTGYEELQVLANLIAEGHTGDIFEMVESQDGRYFLPEEHGLV